jgi:hypothetical protein
MGPCDTVRQEGRESSYDRNLKEVPITQVSTALHIHKNKQNKCKRQT